MTFFQLLFYIVLLHSCLAKVIVVPNNYLEPLQSEQSENYGDFPEKQHYVILTNKGEVAGIISEQKKHDATDFSKGSLRNDEPQKTPSKDNKKPSKEDKKPSKEIQRIKERQKALLQKKITAIADFLQDKYQTTDYFVEEIRRIDETHKIRDELRDMIYYIEHLKGKFGPELRETVLKCYEKEKAKIIAKLEADNYWNQKPNNLNIPIFFDTQA